MEVLNEFVILFVLILKVKIKVIMKFIIIIYKRFGFFVFNIVVFYWIKM